MPRLSVNLLGTFDVRMAERTITTFEYDKVRALLAYLLVESNRPHRREFLAGLLWPEYTERAARQSLSQALLVLRRVIGDRAVDPPYLHISIQTLQFNTHSDFWLDVSQFISSIDVVQQHPHVDLLNCNACLLQLEQAVSLYRGDFMAGFSLPDCPEFEIWLMMVRERLRQDVLDALYHLAQAYLLCGEYELALNNARRQLALDSLREPAYRQVMMALAISGQRSAALAMYGTCVQNLRVDLGVEPEPATVLLYEQIKAIEATGEDEMRLALHLETVAPTPGQPPFQGLDFFDVGDADLFFGRENLTSYLVEQLHNKKRFLAVVGASGSGKSSLVRAGLAATLQNEMNWRISVLTPGREPVEKLQHAVKGLLPISRAQHLIVVDQFEELFTLCRELDIRQSFVDSLLELAESTNNVYVVIALRADFYHHCAQFPVLREMLEQHQVYMGSMTADEFRSAIVSPARQNGWILEPGLVDLILRDIGVHASHPPEPGALPLLSHALLETWHRRQGRTLTLSGYTDAGGVHGAISHTAEAIYQNLDSDAQTIARDIFVRLTELGEGTQDTRRQVPMAELTSMTAEHGIVQMLISRLADARLITSDAQTVQVTHEALIREWPTLRGWLEQDRESLRLQRHLTESSHAWDSLGRDAGELYRGARLQQAKEWAATYPGSLNALEQAFLDEALSKEAQEEHEREAQRQRELAAAEALANAERKRAAERGRLLVWIGLIAILLLVAAAVAVVLGNQSRLTAQENATLAENNAAIAVTAEAARILEAEQRALAENAQQEEARQREAAESAQLEEARQRRLAQDAEYKALVQASVGLAARAMDELDGISPERAVLLALAALEEFPYTPQAESALARAVYENRPYTILPDSGGARYHNTVAWSPDGRYIAAGQYLQEDVALVWGAETAQIAKQIPWDPEIAQQCTGVSVAWSPDGYQLAMFTFHSTIEACHTIQVWNVATGSHQLYTPTGYTAWTLGVDWAPDGSRILSYASDGIARIWDISPDKKENASYQGDGGAVSMTEILSFTITTEAFRMHLGSRGAAVWSPDSQRIATALAWDRVARVWNADSGEALLTLAGHSAGLTDVAWSPDGARLATASMDGNIRIWDAESGRIVQTLAGHTGGQDRAGVQAVAWSPDGARIASAGGDRTVRVWHAGTGEELLRYYGITNPWDVAWSPAGDQLVIRGADEIRILEIQTGPIRLYHEGHAGEVNDAQYSADGSRIATSGAPSSIVRIWNAATGEELLALDGETQRIHLAWSPTAPHIAAGGNPLIVWDTDTGSSLLQIPTEQGWIHTVGWSPDGTRILGSSAYMETWPVYIFDASTGENLWSFGDYGGFKYAEWSPDGKRIATGCLYSADGMCSSRIWDAATGDLLHILESPHGDTHFLEWSPDSTRLATAHIDGTATVWDASTGEPLTVFAGHDQWIPEVTWSPDSTRLASGDLAGIVKGWDASSSAEVFSFQVPGGVVRMDWAPDGEHLVVAGEYNAPIIQSVWQTTDDLISYAYDCCVFRELTLEERAQFLLGE